MSGVRHEHSDLAQGRFSTTVVEKLFTASRYLFAVKPWTRVKADQVLRMDIPTLGIDSACLSIIGQLGESRGDGFERFLAAANPSRREHGAITMGTEWLSLTFQHATELSPSMYREAMSNALPVESPDAYARGAGSRHVECTSLNAVVTAIAGLPPFPRHRSRNAARMSRRNTPDGNKTVGVRRRDEARLTARKTPVRAGLLGVPPEKATGRRTRGRKSP